MPAYPPQSVAAARQVIADRLREIMQDAGISARAIARAAGWHESKCSRIIHARTMPSDDDIRAWCMTCGVPDEIPGLIAASRNADNVYVEWRRVQRSQRRMQDLGLSLFSARQYRFYSSSLILWPAQAPAYMRAVISRFDTFRAGGAPDIDAAVAARASRLRFLDDPSRQVSLVMEESVLRDRTFGDAVMAEQLPRLLLLGQRPNVTLAIIPTGAQRELEPVETFHIYDNRNVSVELVSAVVTVTQPREIALYGRAFAALADAAVSGPHARALIRSAITALHR